MASKMRVRFRLVAIHTPALNCTGHNLNADTTISNDLLYKGTIYSIADIIYGP